MGDPRPSARKLTAEDTARLDRSGAKRFIGRSAAGLAALVLAAVSFGVLVALVTTRSALLLAADRQVAARLNGVVAGNPLLVSVLGVVTDLGGTAASWVILSTATLVLLARRMPRLAGYAAVTGLGAGVLSPAVKALVGRLRPIVETPVGAASGPSFPSGHALGSTVTYGVLLMVVLPVVPRRARPALIAATAVLLIAIGFTRLALGVHYLSDVLAGWLLGLGWLAVTTTAFRPGSRRPVLLRPWRGAAELLVVWVLLLGILLATGWLITGVLSGTALQAFDTAVVQRLAGHRTAALTALSDVVNALGGRVVVSTLTLVSIVLALAVTRQWRAPLFLAVTMAGEVTLFLATARIVDRARPAVPQLDTVPPTSSFPSGHLAAAICLYGALALLVIVSTRSRWRWLVLALAVAAMAFVAFARLYRGAHFPTDLIGSALLALPWLLATWWVLQPGRRPSRDARSASGP